MAETIALQAGRAGDVIGPCSSDNSMPCAYWALAPGECLAQSPTERLAQWVEQVTDQWGPPGRLLTIEGEVVGHALVAPAGLVPALSAFATAPSDPMVPVLLTVVVRATESRSLLPARLLRKHLVHTVIRDLSRQGATSLVAIGSRPRLGPHPCLPLVSDLERWGFHVERDHVRNPRYRLEIRNALALRDEAQEWLSRAAVQLRQRPSRVQAPAHEGASRVR